MQVVGSINLHTQASCWIQVDTFALCPLIKLGVPARLAPPSSYRSTSELAKSRRTLEKPLKMRSKLGREASNFVYSEIRTNAIIEGTVVCRGRRSCPSGHLCAHRAGQNSFFRPSKKQHTVEKGSVENSVWRQLSKVRPFFSCKQKFIDGTVK